MDTYMFYASQGFPDTSKVLQTGFTCSYMVGKNTSYLGQHWEWNGRFPTSGTSFSKKRSRTCISLGATLCYANLNSDSTALKVRSLLWGNLENRIVKQNSCFEQQMADLQQNIRNCWPSLLERWQKQLHVNTCTLKSVWLSTAPCSWDKTIDSI